MIDRYADELKRALRYFPGSDSGTYKDETDVTVCLNGVPVFTANLNTGSIIRHPNVLYAAGCRARGLINRLPIEQRSPHYRRVTSAMNKWRPHVTARSTVAG